LAAGPQFQNTPARADLKTPDVVSLAASRELSPDLTLLAEVQWTNWSVVKNLQIEQPDGSILSSQPEQWHGTWFGSAVTSYLGLQPAQIKVELAAGRTLAQIANATAGKSASGLVAAIVASLKTKLDAAVGAGRLSATTESAILAHVTTKVTAVVSGQWHSWWSSHHQFGARD